jgi:UDP-N-acetylglucosamine 1-carboxyvinyltransferase
VEKFIVVGRGPLRGEVATSGAKNAALPIMAATLLTADECIIENVPLVQDVRTMAELLRQLGCWVDLDEAEHRVTVRAPDRRRLNTDVPLELARKMRASFLVTGAILARAGQVRAPHPGGCSIGRRPVNVDIKSFAAMGAQVLQDADEYVLHADRLHGERIYLDYPSHTGTENVLLAASLAEGSTTLTHASAEPEVSDLISCLQQMGARITGAGTSYLTVDGTDELHGMHYRVMPDRLEAGTYAIAGAISGGEVLILDTVSDHMDPLTHKLREVGLSVDVEPGRYHVRATRRLRPVELQTLHFPGFPTDLQSSFATLLTQADGISLIHERVFDDRLQYAGELRKLGAEIEVSGHTATIHGPSRLTGAKVKALDIRCGAALILAAIVAEGTTEIQDIFHVDRGYESVEAKLRGLGVSIERVPQEIAQTAAVAQPVG